MKNPWKTRDRKLVYQNPWISVEHHEVLNPSGGAGIYGVVQFQNYAIGALPLDGEGNTWLVGQYRYTLDRYSWEIPEGGCPVGQDPLESAKRELQEETGLQAGRWDLLLPEVHLSNSVTNEKGLVYLARDLQHGPASPEETEQLSIRKLPLTEAIDLAMRGTITDLLSITALLKARIWIQEGKLSPGAAS